jgi:hypothetical protein
MKKKFSLPIVLLPAVFFFFVSFENTHAQLFDKGDKIVSLGFGLGSTYYSYSAAYKTSIPPLWISGDYCIMEKLGPGNLGAGAYFGYSGYKSKWYYNNDPYGYKYNVYIIGARGTYHFVDLIDKLDLYGGLLLGAKIVTNKEYGYWEPTHYNTANGSGLAYSFFAGARYFFTDNLSGMAELGYGIAWLSLGVSLKL